MLVSWLGPALVLAAPQAFWRGLTAAFILPKLLLLGLGTGLCAAAVLARRREVRATVLDGPLAGLAAASVASALFSVDPWLSLVGRHGGFSDSLLGLCGALCSWYAASWLDEPRRALIPRLALWAGAAAAAHAVLQTAGLDPWGIGPLPTGRAVAGVGSPVDLGGVLALLFPLALEAARQDGRPAVERVLAVLYLAGLAATGSRAAWLGAGAGALVVLGLSSSLANGSRRRIVVIGLLAAVLAAAVAWRAGARRTFRDSDEARVAVWRTALRAVQARPLLGYGPGTFEHAFRLHRTPDDIKLMRGAYQLQDHAHNGVLDALAQGGALNLAAWAWVCAALAAALWSARGAPGVPA
ncbi:MAG: O-antigen ligase family protein, partial [Elusimicrobia bacterium]|nr:O-antigen ligase family protein [Elusimicrobiota bacterium]